ncbi:aminodeoxychorismate synthase component I [Bacillus benzoevorans]|nr:aminodeoxychorismate synthase component I [Bacillus benzoevorans]
MENINQQKPLLSFEFADSNGEIQPLTFVKPLKVITANRIEEVLPCFQAIQDALHNGYYAAGFLSYESAPAFDSSYKVNTEKTMPLLWFGIFSEPLKEPLSSNGTYKLAQWRPSVKPSEYDAAIQSIKHSIECGDTYQTNYTIQLTSDFQGDDVAFFASLKRAQSSNYCAYIHTGEHRILSASPELFFHLKEGRITTRPMKGTVKRGKSSAEDIANADWLYHSEKNRAENVMIVDLLRNDLNVIANLGTVQVPKLFEVEHYPTVHQMTSTITAEVPADILLADLFKALFPCGSITGAPKISTMNIIADLETAPRGVYCGAIGYITPDQEAVFNVPIRTVVVDQTGRAVYGVGGGITWDSTVEGEYHEILAKASLLEEERPEFHLLESILLENGEFHLLEEHLNRLQSSAQYFAFPFHLEDINQTLQSISKQNKQGKFKIRFLLSQKGEIEIDAQMITPPKVPLKIILADEPLNKDNPFLYHKTTNRSIYSHFQKSHKDVFDILLWNEDGELTEFTNGNVVLEIDGVLWTPPISSGLLAGTFRESLIKEGTIHEKKLTTADLSKSTNIWFINSVRKWLKVQLI